MNPKLATTTVTLLLLCAVALPAVAQTPANKRTDKEAVKFIVEKNIFTPYKPKPKPRPKATPTKPKKPTKPAKKVEVREELRFTGTIYDNNSGAYYATAETIDGEKKLLLTSGETVGLYKIKVILFDRIGLHNTRTKKDEEIAIGDTFEGEVTGSKSSWSSSSSSSGRSRWSRRSTPKTPEKKLPSLSTSKRDEILKRLRERAQKSRARREKMKKTEKKKK